MGASMSTSLGPPKPSFLEMLRAISSRYWQFARKQNFLGTILLIILPVCGVCFLCAIPLSIISPTQTPTPPSIAQRSGAPTLSSANKPTETISPTTDTNETETTRRVLSTLTASVPTPTTEITRLPIESTPTILAGTINANANVRESPSTSAKLITTLKQGAKVRILGRNEQADWLQIDQGWIFAELVDIQGDKATLPNNLSIKPEATSAPAIASQCAQGCTSQLQGCEIKGNISSSDNEKIYHLPGDRGYNSTKIDPNKGERWFCTSAEAEANGFRHAQQQ